MVSRSGTGDSGAVPRAPRISVGRATRIRVPPQPVSIVSMHPLDCSDRSLGSIAERVMKSLAPSELMDTCTSAEFLRRDSLHEEVVDCLLVGIEFLCWNQAVNDVLKDPCCINLVRYHDTV